MFYVLCFYVYVNFEFWDHSNNIWNLLFFVFLYRVLSTQLFLDRYHGFITLWTDNASNHDHDWWGNKLVHCALGYSFSFSPQQSFLLLTELNCTVFDMHLDIVIPPNPCLCSHCWQKGRQWSISVEGQLGRLLFHLGRMMPYKHLCLIFGIIP